MQANINGRWIKMAVRRIDFGDKSILKSYIFSLYFNSWEAFHIAAYFPPS